MFRSREKGKQIGVNEPQQQKEKARFKSNALHDDNITEKKTGLNLKKSTWEYGSSWFMTGLKIKLITKKERKK